MPLLTVQNAKTIKGQKLGYLTGILYLAPVNIADPARNICPFASEGCRAACLFTAGRGQMNSVRAARVKKTQMFHADRAGFIAALRKDIGALIRKADREGLKPAVRLNGTSDLEFWRWIGMEDFPEAVFYDYTKSISRVRAHAAGRLPVNYHLTFSRAEDNSAACLTALQHGINVAAVFSPALPADHLGYPVISGDDTDLRFLDKGPAWIGLTAKGSAKNDNSGFVVRAA